MTLSATLHITDMPRWSANVEHYPAGGSAFVLRAGAVVVKLFWRWS